MRTTRCSGALCTLALTYVADLASALTEMARVVRPGGMIITSDIHVMSLYLGGVSKVDGLAERSSPGRGLGVLARLYHLEPSPERQRVGTIRLTADLAARLRWRGGCL